jgi:glucose/arabinose dehydrogenase
MRARLVLGSLVAMLALVAGCSTTGPPSTDELPDGVDDSQITQLATGLDTPWAITPTPDDTLIVTERGGSILEVDPSEATTTRITSVDAAEVGESGLMGATLHPDDASNLFTCYTHRDDEGELENRVVERDLDTDEETVLVDGIAGARFHDGCRLRLDAENRLLATMGDATRESTAQDSDARSGKVLRMNLDGSPAGALDDGDAYVYTIGHRNPQGVAIHPDTSDVWITEHGPDTHDEVNHLVPGENYGWPDAMGEDTNDGEYEPAVWTTGTEGTVAPAGGAFVDAPDSPLHGAFAFANLKTAKVILLELGENGNVEAQHNLFEGEFGRLRAAQWIDGALVLSTSNQDGRGTPGPNDDRILRVPLSVLEDRVSP